MTHSSWLRRWDAWPRGSGQAAIIAGSLPADGDDLLRGLGAAGQRRVAVVAAGDPVERTAADRRATHGQHLLVGLAEAAGGEVGVEPAGDLALRAAAEGLPAKRGGRLGGQAAEATGGVAVQPAEGARLGAAAEGGAADRRAVLQRGAVAAAGEVAVEPAEGLDPAAVARRAADRRRRLAGEAVLAAAVFTLPPPRVIEMPPVSRPWAAAGWEKLAAPAAAARRRAGSWHAWGGPFLAVAPALWPGVSSIDKPDPTRPPQHPL